MKNKEFHFGLREIPGAPDASFEPAEGTDRWYIGFHYGGEPMDLDEAAEVFARGCVFPGTVPYVLRLEDAALFRPFPQQLNLYYTKPVWDRDAFGILAADFGRKRLLLYRYVPESEPELLAELPLGPSETLSNLRLLASPWTIACSDEYFQVLWPERLRFPLLLGETVQYRDGDRLYSWRWVEEPYYRELLVTRSFKTGELLSCEPGNVYRMPNGELWKL